MAAEYRSRSGSVCKGNYVGNETYREMYMEFLDLKLPYSTTLSLMEAMSTSWGSTPNGGINSDERVCDFFRGLLRIDALRQLQGASLSALRVYRASGADEIL